MVSECIFCGKPAGLFHHEHTACREQHDKAAEQITESFREALKSSVTPVRFRELTQKIAEASYIKEAEYRQLVSQGFGEIINIATSDKIISETEEDRIGSLLKVFELKLIDLPEDAAYRLSKGSILRQLDEGKLPTTLPRIDGYNPINLERGEVIVWIFKNASYLVPHTRTQYVGGSQGVSIRVMKGVYFRLGAFKGAPIQKDYLKKEGVGNLVLSNRNLYFVSKIKSSKIPIRKIISIEPSADGLSISRDGVSAKPAIFIFDDPWFAANAISRLGHLDTA
jgi:hypothetical protein